MTHKHYKLFEVGYTDTQSATFNFDKKLSDRIYTSFFGDRCGIKVCTTWEFNSIENNNFAVTGLYNQPKPNQVIDLLNLNPDIECILFYEFFDRINYRHWKKTIDFCVDRLGIENVKLFGNVEVEEKNSVWCPYWFLACNTMFKEYTNEELLSNGFENTFLCYNRKPSVHRLELQQSFIKNNLMNAGIFTMGNSVKEFEILDNQKARHQSYPNNVGGMYTMGSQEDDKYNIPADAFSLGNLDVWRKSFLCIVTETLCDSDSIGKVPLITEKSYKPIIGMRPFLTVGETKTNEHLHRLQIQTFEDDFPSDPVEAVKFLQNENLELLYEKLYPKIEWNFRRLQRSVSDLKRTYKCLDL